MILKTVTYQDDTLWGYDHWCPGCEELHAIPVRRREGDTGPVWTFNGNLDKPTFTPSVRIVWGRGHEPPLQCHYFITDGNIVYCGDCTHAFNGKTVPLPEILVEHDE